jgi:hypothetical protein
VFVTSSQDQEEEGDTAKKIVQNGYMGLIYQWPS